MSDSTTGQTSVDPQTILSEAKLLYDIFFSFSNSKGVPDFVGTHAAATKAFEHASAPSLVAKVFGAVLSLIAEIAAAALNGLEVAKENSGGGMTDLVSAGLGDLFGQQIPLTKGDTSGGSGNPTADRTAAGEAVFKAFLDMLGGLQEISPQQGLTNAKAFMGFGVNFAVVTAFLGILGGMVPWLHLDELKLIGEELHHSLGLGRLTHTALSPLVRNLIAQPLDLYFKAQLRPDRLSEGQIVQALKSGKMAEGDARQALAEKGYRDSDIDLLITFLAEKIAAGDLFTLVRNGDLTLDQAIQKLTDAGIDQDNAKLIFKALSEAKADSLVSGILADLEAAYSDQFIDQTLYNSVLDKLPLSDDEDAMFRLKVGLHQERTRKRITFAQLKTGIVDGIVDFTYMDTWLAAEGYSDQDQLILGYEILQALQTAEAKAAAHTHLTTKATTKGKKPPPPLAP